MLPISIKNQTIDFEFVANFLLICWREIQILLEFAFLLKSEVRYIQEYASLSHIQTAENETISNVIQF